MPLILAQRGESIPLRHVINYRGRIVIYGTMRSDDKICLETKKLHATVERSARLMDGHRGIGYSVAPGRTCLNRLACESWYGCRHSWPYLCCLVSCAVEGSFFVLANLSRFAALPKVVSKEQFPTASAQMGTGNQAAILVGPALGGFLFQAIGSFATFLADSVSYFVNAISIFFITVPLKTETVSERRAMHIEVKEAFDWYKKQPVIRFLNLMTAGRIGVEAALYLLIVVLAKHHHASSLAIGLIFAIAAVGGMLGSFLAPKIHSNYKLKQSLLGVSIVSTIAFCLYGFANSVAVIAVVTALYYAVDPLFHVTTSSYSAEVIPDGIRGRVVSLTRLQVLAANSLGFFLVGQALEYLSTTTTTYLLAAFLFLLSVAIAANSHLSHV